MYRLCGAKKKQFWTNFKINEHPYPPPQKLPRDRNCIPSNTWFLGLTQVTTLNGISIASCGLSMGKTPQNRPFPWGDLHLYLTYASMGPQDSTTQMVSWSLQPFFHCSPLCPTHTHTHTDRPRYVKTSVGIGCRHPKIATTNTWFLAGLTIVSNRHTDHATS